MKNMVCFDVHVCMYICNVFDASVSCDSSSL